MNRQNCCCHCGKIVTDEGLELKEIGELNPQERWHFCNFTCLHAWAAGMVTALAPVELARLAEGVV